MADTGSRQPLPANLQSAGEYWHNLSRPVQLGFTVAAVALILFVALMLNYLLRTPMKVLFQDMDPAHARQVVEQLEERGVSYKLEEGETTIKVPSDERDRLRLQLLPEMQAQGMGFEIFEDTGLLTSDYERRKQYQAALQEELRRTITSLEVVDGARVHLALPDMRDFQWDRGDPTASVQLRLSPMQELEERQIKGIVYLLTGSVENLEPENVSLIDSRGNLLYDTLHLLEEGTGYGRVEEQMKLTRHFERNLELRLQSLLDRIYGAGSTEVMITAELDFDQWEREEVQYDDNPVPRSQQQTEEWQEGTGVPPEEAGEANIPGYESPYYVGDHRYEFSETVTNYEISEVRELVSGAPGELTRLSAAVAIDDREGTRQVEDDEVSHFIASALGHNAERPDEVNVFRVPFEAVPTPEEIWDPTPYIRYGTWAVVALLAFVLLLVLVLKKTGPSRGYEHKGELPQDFSLDDVMQDREKTEEEEKREKVKKLADEEPENVAYLLRTWLAEE